MFSVKDTAVFYNSLCEIKGEFRMMELTVVCRGIRSHSIPGHRWCQTCMCKRRRCVRNFPMRVPDIQFRCHQPCSPRRQTRCASSIHSSFALLEIRMYRLPHADDSSAIKNSTYQIREDSGVIQVTSRFINLFATTSTPTSESNLGRQPTSLPYRV